MKWILQVSEVSLAVEGPEKWVRSLAEAWGRWEGLLPDWVVRFEPDESLPEPRLPLFQAQPRFENGLCYLEAPGFEGRILPSQREARLRANPSASLGDLTYFLRTAFALCAFEQGALLFHAAGVVHRNSAWAFFGPSGSGKTTLARLSQGKEVLSDDLILLSKGRVGWEAWATPFSLCRGKRMAAPLKALIRLVKAPEDKVMPLPPAIALGELVASSPVVNADPSRLPGLFARWEEIMTEVPVCALRFRKADSFWEVIDAEFG